MKILHLCIVLIIAGLNLFESNWGYAKDISEKEVREIEEEARKKAIESKKLQAQAIQLNLELSKMDKTSISLAKEIQSNEENISKLEEELEKLEQDVKVKEESFQAENKSLILMLSSLQNMSLNPSESVILQPHSPMRSFLTQPRQTGLHPKPLPTAPH